MDIDIEVIDIDSAGSLFDGAYALHRRLALEVDPNRDPDSSESFRANMGNNETFVTRHMVALSDGRAVGLCEMRINNLGSNADKAGIEVRIDPNHRRSGVGTAMVAGALDVCDEIGRSELAVDGVNSDDNHQFWTSLGAERRFVERESRLFLSDTDPELMLQWVSARSERAPGYELHPWKGPTPEHLISHLATLMTAMNDAPIDDLDWEDDDWTEQKVRDFDQYIASRSRVRMGSIVVDGNGDPAGMTVLSTDSMNPRFAGQGDTVVIEEHRRRGIGRWLKGDMWLRLRSDAPEVAAIDTGNAESNDPMLAINLAMGFKPLLELAIWQVSVAEVRTRLPKSP